MILHLWVLNYKTTAIRPTTKNYRKTKKVKISKKRGGTTKNKSCNKSKREGKRNRPSEEQSVNCQILHKSVALRWLFAYLRMAIQLSIKTPIIFKTQLKCYLFFKALTPAQMNLCLKHLMPSLQASQT